MKKLLTILLLLPALAFAAWPGDRPITMIIAPISSSAPARAS